MFDESDLNGDRINSILSVLFGSHINVLAIELLANIIASNDNKIIVVVEIMIDYIMMDDC
ncbi:hypothetical protein DERP_004651 [Dermatophagoides pteronyssinus]|uniref:Uncharacterized protein n=1 Tax=Dermatophagoides pteronyssinus TaxID=6956 RepID=A0ABQ8JQ92_DERPT|nr:hypothetical protein DERP_004651 [Dermatophagoides pteronyssinus]